jgi:hypothetical protein
VYCAWVDALRPWYPIIDTCTALVAVGVQDASLLSFAML